MQDKTPDVKRYYPEEKRAESESRLVGFKLDEALLRIFRCVSFLLSQILAVDKKGLPAKPTSRQERAEDR